MGNTESDHFASRIRYRIVLPVAEPVIDMLWRPGGGDGGWARVPALTTLAVRG